MRFYGLFSRLVTFCYTFLGKKKSGRATALIQTLLLAYLFLIAACAAAKRASGTRKGEQLT